MIFFVKLKRNWRSSSLLAFACSYKKCGCHEWATTEARHCRHCPDPPLNVLYSGHVVHAFLLFSLQWLRSDNHIINEYWLIDWWNRSDVSRYPNIINTSCQTPSKRRTDGRTKRRDASLRPSVRPFVSLSVVSVTGVHAIGEYTAVLQFENNKFKKFKGRG